MAKERTTQTKLKRLYSQLKKHDLQPATRKSRFADGNGIDKTILTRRGKLEKAIVLLEKPKK